MKNLKNIFFLFLTISLFTFTSCDDDEGVVVTPQELITTVVLSLVPEPLNIAFPYTFRDTDGPGGNPPTADTILLNANQLYSLGTNFIDESDSANPEDITAEVQEEADEHLVCYTTTGALPVITTSDTDNNGQPLGLAATFTTGAAGSGTLTVVLKHQPDKGAADPCATGETDVEVTFDVVIQ